MVPFWVTLREPRGNIFSCKGFANAHPRGFVKLLLIDSRMLNQEEIYFFCKKICKFLKMKAKANVKVVKIKAKAIPLKIVSN
jgi:hypothetical protein